MSQSIPFSCPQESNHETTDKNKQSWTYNPGAYPKLDAAVHQHAAAHGTIWSPHLLGPTPISFAEFLQTQELIALCPVGSDARFVLNELQRLDCFNEERDKSKRALTAHIEKSTLFQRCGSYRYVQRIFNSIWRNYDGLLAAKLANLKALIGVKNSILRADERKTKDAARKAAARSADPTTRSGALAARRQRLRDQATNLRALANEKEVKARKWLAQAQALGAAAAEKENEASQIEHKLVVPPTLRKPEERA